MPRRGPRLFLEDVEEAAEKILRYTSGGEAEFRASGVLQDAVLRQLLVIGEAVQHLPEDLLEREAGIPWTRVVGMRNRVVHGYREINMDVVWNSVEHDLPRLQEAVRRLRETMEAEEDG